MIQSFIITGFLGVGKTTMLTNTVKEHFSDKKVAIIVNEFGDIGVDGNILSNVYSEVLEISEGCICCQLAQEFESGVIEIMNKYNPEIIFVETSGASEPFPIFLSLQNLGISVEGVICVVDSKNLGSYKDNSTAKYQIGGSNIIVLNKTDLVNDDELEAVREAHRQHCRDIIKECKTDYPDDNDLQLAVFDKRCDKVFTWIQRAVEEKARGQAG
jgi:G3E family GTPase